MVGERAAGRKCGLDRTAGVCKSGTWRTKSSTELGKSTNANHSPRTQLTNGKTAENHPSKNFTGVAF